MGSLSGRRVRIQSSDPSKERFNGLEGTATFIASHEPMAENTSGIVETTGEKLNVYQIQSDRPELSGEVFTDRDLEPLDE